MVSNKKQLNALITAFENTSEYKTLNQEQREFFNTTFLGQNTLLTGPAGTGKSYCLNLLFSFMQNQQIFVAKTGLTGVAALNVGGQTIHSWAGLGIADEDSRTIAGKVFRNKKAVERIRNTGILFVDEISMASADLLDKLNYVLQTVRFSKEPFGGIQIIFSGDFLQLPPVSKGYGNKLNFAFQASAWESAGIKKVELKKLVRQDESTPYGELLQKIRFGYNENLSILASRVDVELTGDLEPIKIFCKNVDIHAYNKSKYDALATVQEKSYFCKDTGNEKFKAFFDKNCPAEPIVTLKTGAQVMLLVNVDTEAGLVNGAIGKIKGFSPLGPIVQFNNGETSIIDNNKWEAKEQELDLSGKMRYKVVATRSQVPLKLAWATSVHKQQGSTLDQAVIDLSEAFEYGQVYVALSRVKTIEGLSLTSFSPSKIKAHPECLKFYNKSV